MLVQVAQAVPAFVDHETRRILSIAICFEQSRAWLGQCQRPRSGERRSHSLLGASLHLKAQHHGNGQFVRSTGVIDIRPDLLQLALFGGCRSGVAVCRSEQFAGAQPFDTTRPKSLSLRLDLDEFEVFKCQLSTYSSFLMVPHSR